MRPNGWRDIREGLDRQAGIVLAAVKEAFVYRFDALTAILGSLLTMALLYYLWTAIYNNSTSITMSYPALMTYVCLGQAFSFARPGQRRIFVRIGTGIRSGNVMMDLLRPTDYQMLTFSDTLGAYLVETLLVSVPSYLIALGLFRIDLPASPQAAFGFALSFLGAYYLVFSVDFLIGLTAFWTNNIWGVVWGLGYVKIALLDIFAGTLIPLSLFPDWLKAIAYALPFQGMAYTPLAIYVGAIGGDDIWAAIANQLVWGTVLILFTRLVWLKALRRIEIQGG